MMACNKCTLTNTGSTIVNFSYQRCDDYYWDYQVELLPNQTKNIWFVDDTYTVAQSFVSLIVLSNCGEFPSLSVTNTPTPSNTQTPSPTITPTETPTNTPTPSVTASQTETPTSTPTETPTNTPSSSARLTPSPSESPTETPTPTPTGTPISTPSPTPAEQIIVDPLLIGNDEYLSVGDNEYLQFN
jgi:hypothetical protein